MGQSEIEAYLNHMTDKRKVSANTQSVALNAIAFLYREVLKMEMPCLKNSDGLNAINQSLWSCRSERLNKPWLTWMDRLA